MLQMESFVAELLLAIYSIGKLLCLQPQPINSLAVLCHVINILSSLRVFYFSSQPPYFVEGYRVLSASAQCLLFHRTCWISLRYIMFHCLIWSPALLCFFHPNFKLSKDVSNFRLILHEINPTHSCMIINKSNVILIAIQWWCFQRSSHVSMH